MLPAEVTVIPKGSSRCAISSSLPWLWVATSSSVPVKRRMSGDGLGLSFDEC
jgi:hypothetical protein